VVDSESESSGLGRFRSARGGSLGSASSGMTGRARTQTQTESGVGRSLEKEKEKEKSKERYLVVCEPGWTGADCSVKVKEAKCNEGKGCSGHGRCTQFGCICEG